MLVGSHGMVSAGHSLAAAAALDVLQHGGNAVDAALTASAVQCVVEMPWCSLGGDAFMLVYTPADGVLAFNGSGAALELRTIGGSVSVGLAEDAGTTASDSAAAG